MRPLLPLIAVVCALAAPASAGSLITLELDPTLSTVDFSGPPPGSGTLSGTLTIELGALPPLAATTSFDLRALSASASSPGSFTIGLDPDIANPGAGVLNVAGQFLIPTLFLTLDDGVTSTDLALANVTGTFFANGPSCAFAYCAFSSFEIDGGESFGLISVEVTAIPEPSTAALLGAGCLLLALHSRRRGGVR
jgi:hypothetical protein